MSVLELKDLVKRFSGVGWTCDVYLTAHGTYVCIVVVNEEKSITEEFDKLDDASGAGFQIVLEDLGV